MLFLNNINLNKNELQNARLQNLASAPNSPVGGQIYFDTVLLGSYVWNGTTWAPNDTSKVADGSIAIAKLAVNPLARANHTGTQAASTISDFTSVAQGLINTTRLNGLTAPNADVAFGGFKLTGVATPVAGTDGANKQYVDDTVAGLSWKNEVRIATTAAGTLASSFANGSTVDGTVLATGNRILIKDQAAGQENGIYTVNASGAPTRATDADTAGEIEGAAVFVTNGTANGGTRWVCNTSSPITIGTTPLGFVAFGGGSSYVAGNGISLAGNSFSVNPAASGGLAVTAGGVAVDTAIVVRKFSVLVGDNSATSIAVTHSLGTQDITLAVLDASSKAMVMVDWVATSASVATLTFVVAPTSNQYRVVVHG